MSEDRSGRQWGLLSSGTLGNNSGGMQVEKRITELYGGGTQMKENQGGGQRESGRERKEGKSRIGTRHKSLSCYSLPTHSV